MCELIMSDRHQRVSLSLTTINLYPFLSSSLLFSIPASTVLYPCYSLSLLLYLCCPISLLLYLCYLCHPLSLHSQPLLSCPQSPFPSPTIGTSYTSMRRSTGHLRVLSIKQCFRRSWTRSPLMRGTNSKALKRSCKR